METSGGQNRGAAAVTGDVLARNSFFELLAQASRTVLKIVQTPIVLAVLGLERYGIFSLIFALCVYIEQFNMSFGFAYSKFTAEFDVKGEFKKLAAVISSGIVIVCSGAAVVISLFWIFQTPILSFFRVRESYIEDAGAAFFVVVLALMIRMSVGCYWRMLAGLQRVDLQKKLEIVANVLEMGLSLALLFTLGGVVSLALAFLAHEAFLAASSWWMWRRLRAPLGLSPFKASRYGFRRILSLGGKFQLLSLLGMGITQSMKPVLSALFGTAMLGIYDLADKIVNMGRMAPMAVINPLLPAFTNLHVRGALKEALALYLRVSRILALITFMVFGFVLLVPELFLYGWTGIPFQYAPQVLQILALSAAIHLLTGVGTASLRSRESLSYEFKYYGLQMATILVLLYPLYLAWGFLGMVTAFSAGFGLGAVWFLVAYGSLENIPFRVYLKSVVYEPAVRVVGVMGLFLGLKAVWPSLFEIQASRMTVLLNLALLGAAFSLLVGAAAWYTGLLDRREREMVRRFRDRIFRRRGGPPPGAKSPPDRELKPMETSSGG